MTNVNSRSVDGNAPPDRDAVEIERSRLERRVGRPAPPRASSCDEQQAQAAAVVGARSVSAPL